jgi:magnesium-transporting ATPase (P-type)
MGNLSLDRPVPFEFMHYCPVAFIPEGLPIAVKLSLAKVAHTLSKHKVLCK